MKVLVTGANGFIGSHVCRELAARGIAIRALVRPGADTRRLRVLDSDLEWSHCDLLGASDEQLEALAQGVEACIHLAWDVTPGQYLLSATNPQYRDASLRLFAALVKRRCVHITGVGTCFEYAPADHPLGETSVLGPTTPYAREKLAAYTRGTELLNGTGTSLAWARLFYLYGPGESPQRLVADVAIKLLEGNRLAVTTGRQQRDFLHVADVAGALTTVTLSGLPGPINIGSGEPVRVIDVVNTIASIAGRPDLLDVGARPDNLVDPPYVCADNTRLRTETEWRRRYSLAEGIADTMAWWREALRIPPR